MHIFKLSNLAYNHPKKEGSGMGEGIDYSDLLKYTPDTFGTLRVLSIEKYPGEMAIARELIQNADDAESTWMRFNFCSDQVLITNNGKPFTRPDKVRDMRKSDFYRVSHLGVGKDEEEMGGTYGIGFSSVFHITDSPTIVSNGWKFTIRVGDKPIIEEVQFEENTEFLLPYRKSHSNLSRLIRAETFDEGKVQSFVEDLPHEALRSLLFLKKLNKVEICVDGKLQCLVSRKAKRREVKVRGITSHWVTLTQEWIDKGTASKHRWLRFQKTGIHVPKQLKELGWRKPQSVSIAFELGSKTETLYCAYALLPVKRTGFNFSWNSSKFEIISGRQEFNLKIGIKLDWNMWQMKNLAVLFTGVLEDLARDKNHRHLVYVLLPSEDNCEDETESRFYKELQERIETTRTSFCHTVDNKIRTPGVVCIGGDHIRDLLPRTTYREFLHPKFIPQADILADEYGSNRMDEKEILSLLENVKDDAFLKRKLKAPRLSQNLYEFLDNLDWSGEDLEKLKTLDFLLTRANTLVKARYPVFFAKEKYIQYTDNDDILMGETCQSRRSRHFLRAVLRIDDMTLEHLVVSCFLLRLTSVGYSRKSISSFLWYLVQQGKQVTENEAIIGGLNRERRVLLNIEKSSISDDVYFRNPKLQKAFGAHLTYLDSFFDKRGEEEGIRRWRSLFSKLGVKERATPEVAVERARAISAKGYSKTAREQSKSLFEYLKANWSFYQSASQRLVPLKDIEWIPTTNKTLEKPGNVYSSRKWKPIAGPNAHYVAFDVPRDSQITKSLAFRREPRMRDVVNHLLSHTNVEPPRKPKRPDPRIYTFMNRRVGNLTEEMIEELTSNSIIWFKGRMWDPYQVFTRDHSKIFGPNGRLRAYVGRDRIAGLRRLFRALDIRKTPNAPEDYVYALENLAEIEGDWEPWTQKVFDRCLGVVAKLSSELEDHMWDDLLEIPLVRDRDGKAYEASRCLLVPSRFNRIPLIKQVIEGLEGKVPLIVVDDPVLGHLYEELDATPLHRALELRLVSTGMKKRDKISEGRLKKAIGYLLGIEFRATGNHSALQKTYRMLKGARVFRVDDLWAKCVVSIEDRTEELGPFECGVLITSKEDPLSLFLSESFDWRSTRDLESLGMALIPLLNPDVETALWEISLPQLLRSGRISGIEEIKRVKGKFTTREVTAPESAKDERTRKYHKYPSENGEGDVDIDDTYDVEGAIEKGLKELRGGKKGEPDLSKLKKKGKRIRSIKHKARVRVRPDTQISAEKNFKMVEVDGEDILIPDGAEANIEGEEIAVFRQVMEGVVGLLGGNPETVHILCGPEHIDAFIHEGQLIYNLAVVNDVSPFYWVVVTARELAYHVTPRATSSYPHTKAMSIILVKALDHFEELQSALKPLDRLPVV